MPNFNNGAYDGSNRMANAGQVISFYSFTRDDEVSFKPFLKSFRDSYKSNWERKAVYGRPDPIQTYQNTQRTISLTWEVVAGSTQEAISNLNRVSRLTQMLYPSYGGQRADLIKKAPVLRVKFLNLITDPDKAGRGPARTMGLLASVDGFEYSILQEYGFLGGNAFGSQVEDGAVPKVIEISCTIHPMHEFTVGAGGTNLFPYGLKTAATSEEGLTLSGPPVQSATIFKQIADGLTPPRVTSPGGGLNNNATLDAGGITVPDFTAPEIKTGDPGKRE